VQLNFLLIPPRQFAACLWLCILFSVCTNRRHLWSLRCCRNIACTALNGHVLHFPEVVRSWR